MYEGVDILACVWECVYMHVHQVHSCVYAEFTCMCAYIYIHVRVYVFTQRSRV